MRCAWIALVFTAVASVASARVVMSPTIPRTCPAGKTWEQVNKCLARFGKVTLERDLDGAKLVRVDGEGGFRVPGLYLYAQRGAAWKLAGMFETSGDDVAIVGFQRLTLAKHTGYRLDIGLATAATSDVDSEIARPAILQEKIAVFCAGTSFRCSAVITSCDMLVEGRSRASFRGTVKFDRDTVHVVGDRSRSAIFCETPETQPLGWAGNDDDIDF
ncbi:MAG TPA: hypothetical protein VLB44_09605 [Kofleriaceae bacterium]|nr:hypothetical protein [Kofleriaceae bacterium]